MKFKLWQHIDCQSTMLVELADRICDNPEVGLQEYLVSGWLCNYLEQHAFRVQLGIGGLETAFRGEYTTAGYTKDCPSIGLLCEYDALEGIGHGCGHHLQGPCICGAASALTEILQQEYSFRVVVYGTPAEETSGGKITMLQNGCFQDIDVALMMHASSSGTGVDKRTLAMSSFDVTFCGQGAHAAIAPEKGRSALDAMLLSFNAIEFMREHVEPDVRMHYTIAAPTGPVNVIHPLATGSYSFRALERKKLDEVIERFLRIVEGACLMTGTTSNVVPKSAYDNTITADTLREVLLANAREIGAPDIRLPREKTGSNDFGNITYQLPGACIRVASDGVHPVPGHTKEAAAQGKSEENHQALLFGAKILAGTSYDLITQPELLVAVQTEFREKKYNK